MEEKINFLGRTFNTKKELNKYCYLNYSNLVGENKYRFFILYYFLGFFLVLPLFLVLTNSFLFGFFIYVFLPYLWNIDKFLVKNEISSYKNRFLKNASKEEISIADLEIKLKNLENSYSRRYICQSCGYGWESRKSFGSPSSCPNCRSKEICNSIDISIYEVQNELSKLKGIYLDTIPKPNFEYEPSKNFSLSLNLKDKEVSFPCPNCNLHNKLEIKDLPKRGNKLITNCSNCSLEFTIEVPSESYVCAGCKKKFEYITDKLKHQKICSKYKEKSFGCSNCKEIFVLDNHELKELKRKKFIEVSCPKCNEENKIKLSSS